MTFQWHTSDKVIPPKFPKQYLLMKMKCSNTLDYMGDFLPHSEPHHSHVPYPWASVTLSSATFSGLISGAHTPNTHLPFAQLALPLATQWIYFVMLWFPSGIRISMPNLPMWAEDQWLCRNPPGFFGIRLRLLRQQPWELSKYQVLGPLWCDAAVATISRVLIE